MKILWVTTFDIKPFSYFDYNPTLTKLIMGSCIIAKHYGKMMLSLNVHVFMVAE